MGEGARWHSEAGTGCRRMTLSFGYLNKIGYKGFVFPIVIGEAGSRYTDVSSITTLCTLCTLCPLLPGSPPYAPGHAAV